MRATLEDSGARVPLNIRFGAAGEIVSVEGERYRDAGGKGVLTPWIGQFSDYRRAEDMMIPHSGEVAWIPPEGRSPCWRGRITKAEYSPALDRISRNPAVMGGKPSIRGLRAAVGTIVGLVAAGKDVLRTIHRSQVYGPITPGA